MDERDVQPPEGRSRTGRAAVSQIGKLLGKEIASHDDLKTWFERHGASRDEELLALVEDH
jgi:hypothetical protein